MKQTRQNFRQTDKILVELVIYPRESWTFFFCSF